MGLRFVCEPYSGGPKRKGKKKSQSRLLFEQRNHARDPPPSLSQATLAGGIHFHRRRSTAVSGILVMEMMKRCSDIQVSSNRPRKAMRIAINSWSTILLRYIPEDVLFKILSWLPSKSLIRFRSVCKAWHATISSSRFVNAHLECSKQRPSLLVIPGSFEMKKNGIRKWIRSVHCDGLLLISTRKHKMMICNPSTREIVSPPEGSHSLCGGMGLGFGFDPHSNKYKVARAFYQRDYPTTRQVCKFEVLTLGTDAWRQTEDPPYPIDRLTRSCERSHLLEVGHWNWRFGPVVLGKTLNGLYAVLRKLLLASNKVYRYDIQTCKLEKIASTFEDFTC
uniref:F-box domain-containing protein n=1 Tax=Oryza glumipatula TaxID=40148 RepID=A0A0E0B3M6_9ORYZ